MTKLHRFAASVGRFIHGLLCPLCDSPTWQPLSFVKAAIVYPRGNTPIAGTEVTFTLSRTKAKKRLVATEVRAVAVTGIVENSSLSGGTKGLIRLATPIEVCDSVHVSS